MPLNKKLNLILIALTLTYANFAQAQQALVLDTLAHIQVYPTGIISTLRLEKNISKQNMFGIGLGYNLVRHRDLGEHDDERGGGIGGSVELSHYFNSTYTAWVATARTDVWHNHIDWEGSINLTGEATGKTDVWVLQPTLELGYVFLINQKWIIKPTAAFGIELNIVTNGEDVGQGLIGLLGLSFGWRHQKD